MKNLLILVVAAFSMNSYAGGSYGLNYNTWDVEGTSVDGVGITLSGAGENILYDLDVFRLSTGGFSATLNTLSLGYAFGDLAEGSVFGGIWTGGSNIEGTSRETDFMLGWAKRGGAGNQVKVGVVTDDGNSILAEVQMESGFEVGILSNDGDTMFTIGYGWKF